MYNKTKTELKEAKRLNGVVELGDNCLLVHHYNPFDITQSNLIGG